MAEHTERQAPVAAGATPVHLEAPALIKSVTSAVDGIALPPPAAMERDRALAVATGNLDRWERHSWESVIAFLARGSQPFTSDHCRAVGAPETANPNHVGVFFMAAARAGVIKPVGFVQSTRRPRHAAWLRQWIGAEAA